MVAKRHYAAGGQVRGLVPRSTQTDMWIDNIPVDRYDTANTADRKLTIKPKSPNDDMVTGPQPEGTPTWMEHRRGGRVNKVMKKRGRYDEGGSVNTYVSRDAPNVTSGGSQRSAGLPPSGAFGDRPLDLTPPSKTAQATPQGKARGGPVKKVVKGYQRGGVVTGDTAPGAASASSHKWSANIAGRNVTMKNKGGKIGNLKKGRR